MTIRLFAQNKLDSVQSIPEVIINSKRYQEVIPVQRLTGKTLEALSSHSVADAIRYFSGVQLKDYGGIGGVKTINIRSMGSQHVGVFYDGIQLGNAQNGQIDLGRYSLDNVDEISLYNGQKSQIFQSAKDYASSGSIYLRTRRPRFEKDRKYNLKVACKSGSFGLVNPSLLYEQQLNSKLLLSFSTAYTHANGKYKFRYKRSFIDGTVAYDTTATRQNGQLDAYRAELSLFGVSRGGGWQLKSYYYDSDRGIPGPIVNNSFRNGEQQSDRNFFIQGNWKNDFHNGYQLLINAKYAHDFCHYIRDDKRLYYIDNTFRQQEFYFSTTQLYTLLSGWDLSLAVDIQHNRLRANLTDFAYPLRMQELIALASSLHIGHFDLMGNLLTTFVQDRVSSNKVYLENNKKGVLTPSLFASWKPQDQGDFTLRAFYKRAFRLPTFNDLYYTHIGNANLKPEYTTQYDCGWTWSHNIREKLVRNVELQADLYYNRVTNKIIATPTSQQFRWTMINLGKVRILGVDAAASTTLNIKNVTWNNRINYTWQKARDYSERLESYYGDQIPYIPVHSGSFISSVQWRKWQFNYSFIYTGERYSESANIAVNKLQPWYTSDLSLHNTIRLKSCLLKVGAEVNNIFNQYYDVIINYPMPGTNFNILLSLTI